MFANSVGHVNQLIIGAILATVTRFKAAIADEILQLAAVGLGVSGLLAVETGHTGYVASVIAST